MDAQRLHSSGCPACCPTCNSGADRWFWYTDITHSEPVSWRVRTARTTPGGPLLPHLLIKSAAKSGMAEARILQGFCMQPALHSCLPCRSAAAAARTDRTYNYRNPPLQRFDGNPKNTGIHQTQHCSLWFHQRDHLPAHRRPASDITSNEVHSTRSQLGWERRCKSGSGSTLRCVRLRRRRSCMGQRFALLA